MAERWAVATGNANATATWNGGTLPAIDDDVYANGFTVTVNVNTHWKNAYTLAGTTAVAGGGFTLSNGVTLTLNNGNGEARAGSTTCVTFAGTTGNSATLIGHPIGSATTGSRYGVSNTSSGTLNITGNPTGGAAASAFGVLNNSTGTVNVTGNPSAGAGSASAGTRNASTGTLNITGTVTGNAAGMAAYWASGGGTVTGTVTGGTASSTSGLQNAGSGTITIVGSVVGGSAAIAIGPLNSSSGTITVTGNATGGSNATAYGASNTGTGTLTVNGKAISNVGPGVNSSVTGSTTIASAEMGTNRVFPYAGKVAFIDLSVATLGVRDSSGTLVTLSAGGVKNVFHPPSVFGAT